MAEHADIRKLFSCVLRFKENFVFQIFYRCCIDYLCNKVLTLEWVYDLQPQLDLYRSSLNTNTVIKRFRIESRDVTSPDSMRMSSDAMITYQLTVIGEEENIFSVHFSSTDF